MGDDAPRLRRARLRRLSQSEAGRCRRRLTDPGAVRPFGAGSVRRRQNSRIADIILLKAEPRLIVGGMTGSPFARLRARTYDAANAVAAPHFATRAGGRRLGINFLFQSAITH